MPASRLRPRPYALLPARRTKTKPRHFARVDSAAAAAAAAASVAAVAVAAAAAASAAPAASAAAVAAAYTC